MKTLYSMCTVLAFGYVFALASCGHPAYAFTTRRDFQSNDTPTIEIPRDSQTVCVGGVNTANCINRSFKPEPTGCPEGQVFITMRAYGYVSHQCVPE